MVPIYKRIQTTRSCTVTCGVTCTERGHRDYLEQVDGSGWHAVAPKGLFTAICGSETCAEGLRDIGAMEDVGSNGAAPGGCGDSCDGSRNALGSSSCNVPMGGILAAETACTLHWGASEEPAHDSGSGVVGGHGAHFASTVHRW